MTRTRTTIAMRVALALTWAVGARAAGLYFAGDHSSGDLTITARESSGNDFWKMVVTGPGGASDNPGRIREFYDLTGEGNSTSTFNVAYHYLTWGMGLWDPTDYGAMRDTGKWTLAPGTGTDGADSYTWTLSHDEVRGSVTAEYSMVFTVMAPDASGTRFISTNVFDYPEGWVGANGDARCRGELRLYASDEGGAGNEYTHASYNGFLSGIYTQWTEHVVNAGVTNLAEGRSYKMTHSFSVGDDAYDTAATGYSTAGAAYSYGTYEQAITGTWAGNPGTVGAGGAVYSSTTTLDINIAAPPAEGGVVVIR